MATITEMIKINGKMYPYTRDMTSEEEAIFFDDFWASCETMTNGLAVDIAYRPGSRSAQSGVAVYQAMSDVTGGLIGVGETLDDATDDNILFAVVDTEVT